MAKRSVQAATAFAALMLAVTPAAASAAVAPPMRYVAYVPSIVSVPATPRWGHTIRYEIQVHSRAGVARKISVGFELYLAAATGGANTQLGVYHRTIAAPATGTVTFGFTAAAPTQSSTHQLCLAVTIAGDSSGAFVCVPVTF